MSVENWGIGKPDFVEITSPTRTEVQSESQTAWSLVIDDYCLSANTTITIANFYTVPANKKLVIGYIKATANIDCIFGTTMLRNGVAFCPLFHPQLTMISLPDTAGFIFDAGDMLGGKFENPLSATLTIRGDVSGFLYDV